jgi:hypothetical protein
LRLLRSQRSRLNIISKSLTVAAHGFGVASLPASIGGTTNCVVGTMTTNTKSSGFATSGGKSTSLSVFHDRFADPVDARIVSDNYVGWVNKDDFVIFVGGILVDPVRVQDTQVGSNAPNALFSNAAKISCELKLVNSLVSWFTMDDTLSNRTLTTTSANSNTVDNKTLEKGRIRILLINKNERNNLFCFVSKFVSFISSGWSVNSDNLLVLSVFPGTINSNENNNNFRANDRSRENSNIPNT